MSTLPTVGLGHPLAPLAEHFPLTNKRERQLYLVTSPSAADRAAASNGSPSARLSVVSDACAAASRHAQRFLSVRSVVSNHNRACRHRLRAGHYREIMHRRFVEWRAITGTEMEIGTAGR